MTNPPAPASPTGRTATIIGSGIGGPAAALARHRSGFEVRLFEQAPALREVGAGIAILPNAARALEALGLGEVLRHRSHPLHRGEFASSSGRRLVSIPFHRALGTEARFSIVHRADLLAWLLEELPPGSIQTGKRCTGITERGDHVRVAFSDGTHADAPCLIGADGARSVVRSALHGPITRRHSGQTCYRAIANFEPNDPEVLREVQGPGRRASVIALGNGRAYWWAALNAPPDAEPAGSDRKSLHLDAFRHWPFDIPEAIAATDTGASLRNVSAGSSSLQAPCRASAAPSRPIASEDLAAEPQPPVQTNSRSSSWST